MKYITVTPYLNIFDYLYVVTQEVCQQFKLRKENVINKHLVHDKEH